MADLSVRLLVIAMAVMCSCCMAHADCMDVVISLSPCMDYIMNNVTSQPPSSECCLQLMAVVQAQPLCLCTILDGEVGAKLGIPIDKNRALALPAACGVQTPPVTECTGGAVPVPTPVPISSDGSHAPWSFSLLFLSCIVYALLMY